MFLVNAVRDVFMIMVNIISEFASFFAIRILLNEKKFKSDKDLKDKDTEDIELLASIV